MKNFALVTAPGDSFQEYLLSALFLWETLKAKGINLDWYHLDKAGRLGELPKIAESMEGDQTLRDFLDSQEWGREKGESPESRFFRHAQGGGYDLVLLFTAPQSFPGRLQGICELFNIPFSGPGIRNHILCGRPEYFHIYSQGRELNPSVNDSEGISSSMLVFHNRKKSGVFLQELPRREGIDLDYELQHFGQHCFHSFALNGFAWVDTVLRDNQLHLRSIHPTPPIHPSSPAGHLLMANGWTPGEIALFLIEASLEAHGRAEEQKKQWTVY